MPMGSTSMTGSLSSWRTAARISHIARLRTCAWDPEYAGSKRCCRWELMWGSRLTAVPPMIHPTCWAKFAMRCCCKGCTMGRRPFPHSMSSKWGLKMVPGCWALKMSEKSVKAGRPIWPYSMWPNWNTAVHLPIRYRRLSSLDIIMEPNIRSLMVK